MVEPREAMDLAGEGVFLLFVQSYSSELSPQHTHTLTRHDGNNLSREYTQNVKKLFMCTMYLLYVLFLTYVDELQGA